MLHLPYPAGKAKASSLRRYLNLSLTFTSVNVLTKLDNLAAVGGADLPFNLDFYTEVQDLTQLIPALEAENSSTPGPSIPAQKLEALNTALIQLIEDFGLIGFETLAVEDKQSMAQLLRAIDRASGYVFAGARGTDETGRTLQGEASVWAQAMSESWMGKMEVRDVQERWIERKDEFDELERQGWEEEARKAGALDGGEKPAATVIGPDGGVEEMEIDRGGEDDDLLAEQRRWEAQRGKGDAVGGDGPKVVR